MGPAERSPEAQQRHHRALESMYASAPTNASYEGLRLALSAGRAELELEVRPELFHAAGALHGAHYFKLLDDAAYFAVQSQIDDCMIFTTQFSLQLLRPIQEGRLRAEGWVVKLGSGTLFGSSQILIESGKVAAVGQGSFQRSPYRLLERSGYHRVWDELSG